MKSINEEEKITNICGIKNIANIKSKARRLRNIKKSSHHTDRVLFSGN
jgi:hypothetical protein